MEGTGTQYTNPDSAASGRLQGPDIGGVGDITGLTDIDMSRPRATTEEITTPYWPSEALRERVVSPTRTIHGPLRPGERVISGLLEIDQPNPYLAFIRLGRSEIAICSNEGDVYDFFIERQTSSVQRLVRISATREVEICKKLDASAPFELIVHVQRVSNPSLVHSAPRPPVHLTEDDNIELIDTGASSDQEIVILRHECGVSLMVDRSVVRIEEKEPHARFSVELAREWSGADGLERKVHIVATPGVRVEQRSPSRAGSLRSTFGRRLVANLIRVQDQKLVAGADDIGIEPMDFMPVSLVNAAAPDGSRTALLASTGRQGVTVRDLGDGTAVRLAPADAMLGACYAYELIAPHAREGGGCRPAIHALVGPGVSVEVTGSRSSAAGRAGSRVCAPSNVDVVLYETDDAAAVPAQGSPLPEAMMRAVGRRRLPVDLRSMPLRFLEQEPRPTYGGVARWQMARPSRAAATSSQEDIMPAGPSARERAFAEILGRRAVPCDHALMSLLELFSSVDASSLRAAQRSEPRARALAAELGTSCDEMDAALARLRHLTPEDWSILFCPGTI